MHSQSVALLEVRVHASSPVRLEQELSASVRRGETLLSIAGSGRGFKVLCQRGVGQTDTGTWVGCKVVARGSH